MSETETDDRSFIRAFPKEQSVSDGWIVFKCVGRGV